ncbi:hypothetical protein LXA43DRAFT_750414 [Ganoderma leucocontextum]|nr:hypothetical protein LXA43DRAFT_750414 [Ganoderma leucocontextum]
MSTSASEVEALTDNVIRPTQFPVIPGDIVAQVCKEIFARSPTIDQCDPSLMRGPHSQWCSDLRFRKGLTLVSKLWWEPAIRALYEHVVIRRFGQIPALARTLSSKDAGIDFGGLVRKITLHQCAFFWPCVDVVCEDLRSILDRCVALEEFSFRRHPECDDAFSEEHKISFPQFGINPVWLFPQVIFPGLQPRGSTTLRKLDVMTLGCWQEPVATALLNLISSSPRITTLAIRNFDLPGSELPTLEFLEELWVEFDLTNFTPVSSSSPRAIWKWELPRLKSLTILNDEGLPTILEKLGRTLTYLHIACDVACFGEGFDRLSQQCPLLEHLVFYPPYGLEGWAYTLFRGSVEPFRRLRYLDLWFKDKLDPRLWHPSAAASQLERARSSYAPALEGVRGLIAFSYMPVHDDLPRICDPSMITRTDDTRFVCVRDVWMAQTAWCVRPVGDWWFGGEMWLEDDSGDYEASDCDGKDDEDRTSWVSGDDSETGSGSVLEAGDGDEDEQAAIMEEGKGEQLGREEILEGFRQSQEGCFLVEQVESRGDVALDVL